ncbi:uncharacterized protein LOC141899285 [Tubulanus polymorphus]|uniref:uncharacterized protein LOC141899285 n=1 Tax=Tubulanus polymorphus TaxID=672921 RepID=UPI003DA6C729
MLKSVRRSSLSLSTSPINPRKVTVVLLDGEQLELVIDVKSRVNHVYCQVCQHLSLRENEYFGLASYKDEEYQFLDLDHKLQKYASKSWRSKRSNGCDASGKPLLVLYFRVQYYVNYKLLRERTSRKLYYLQLRENVLRFCQLCGEERHFQLAAYAMQADLGNFYGKKHSGTYFEPSEYFPAWIIANRGIPYIMKNMPKFHKDLRGMSKMEAQIQFIKEASSQPAAHNIHLYPIRLKKSDKKPNLWMGICPTGLEIYEPREDGFKSLMGMFEWTSVQRLQFDRKKFQIRMVNGGRRFAYYTTTQDQAAHLFWLCQKTHQLQMSVKKSLAELRRLELEEKKRYRESYIYSSTDDLAWEQQHNGDLTYRPRHKAYSDPTNRISVASKTSSGSTSGIVSDRLHASIAGSEENSPFMDHNSPIQSGRVKNPQFVAQNKTCVSMPANLNETTKSLTTVEIHKSHDKLETAGFDNPGFENLIGDSEESLLSDKPHRGVRPASIAGFESSDPVSKTGLNVGLYNLNLNPPVIGQQDYQPNTLQTVNTVSTEKPIASGQNNQVTIPMSQSEGISCDITYEPQTYAPYTLVSSVPRTVQVAHSTMVNPLNTNSKINEQPRAPVPVQYKPTISGQVQMVATSRPISSRPEYLSHYVNDEVHSDREVIDLPYISAMKTLPVYPDGSGSSFPIYENVIIDRDVYSQANSVQLYTDGLPAYSNPNHSLYENSAAENQAVRVNSHLPMYSEATAANPPIYSDMHNLVHIPYSDANVTTNHRTPSSSSSVSYQTPSSKHHTSGGSFDSLRSQPNLQQDICMNLDRIGTSEFAEMNFITSKSQMSRSTEQLLAQPAIKANSNKKTKLVAKAHSFGEETRLHPDLEGFRGIHNSMSLPLITALCNDRTLLNIHTESPLHSHEEEMSENSTLKSERKTSAGKRREKFAETARQRTPSGYSVDTEYSMETMVSIKSVQENNSLSDPSSDVPLDDISLLDEEDATMIDGMDNISEASSMQSLKILNSQSLIRVDANHNPSRSPSDSNSSSSNHTSFKQVPTKLNSGGHNNLIVYELNDNMPETFSVA